VKIDAIWNLSGIIEADPVKLSDLTWVFVMPGKQAKNNRIERLYGCH